MAQAGIVDINGEVIINYNTNELTINRKLTMFDINKIIVDSGLITENPISKKSKASNDKRGRTSYSNRYILKNTWVLKENYAK